MLTGSWSGAVRGAASAVAVRVLGTRGGTASEGMSADWVVALRCALGYQCSWHESPDGERKDC